MKFKIWEKLTGGRSGLILIWALAALSLILVLEHILNLGQFLTGTNQSNIFWGEIIFDLLAILSIGIISLALINVSESRRRRAERTLLYGEGRYKDLFENSPLGFYRTTPDGQILLANSALVQMLGYNSFEELTKRNLEKEGFEPKYPRSQFKEIMDKMGEVKGLESAWMRHDKKVLFVRENAKAIRDENDRILYYEGTAEDITERKKAEEALRQSEQKYRELVETSIDMIFTLDQKGNFLFSNKAWRNRLGFSQEETNNLNGFELIHSEDLKNTKERFGEVLQGKIVEGLEFKSKTKDGSSINIIINASPIFDSQGNVIAVLGVGRDITEQKKKEEELIRLSTAVKTSSDSIVICDLQGKIVDANEATLEMYRTGNKSDLVGKNVFEFISPEERERAIAGMNDTLQKGYAKNREYSIYLMDGSRIPVEISTALMKDREGKPIGFAGITRDIRERKKAEQIQLVQYKIANAVNTTKDIQELIQIIHKELGTILDTTNFFISLYDKETDTLSLPYYVDEKDRFTSFPAVKTKTSYVIKKKEPVLVTQEVREKLIRAGEIEAFGTPSNIWLGVPLKIGEEIIGVVAVQSYTDSYAYGEKEMEILKFVSEEIALAIERKKAEEALRESEERFRQFAENIDQVFWLTDWDAKRLLYVNPAFERLYGRSCQSAYHNRMNWQEVIYPEDRDRVKEAFSRSADLGQYVEAEYRIVRDDGTVRWVLDRSYPIRDKHGRIYRFASVAEDITERKKVENALKESEEKYRSFVERANDGIAIIQDLELRYVNPSLAKMMGYTVQEMTGTKATDYTHPDERPKLVDMYKKRMAGGNVPNIYETALLSKGGKKLNIEVNVGMISYMGKPASLVIYRDITERKKAEEKLRESEERYNALFERSLDCVYIHDFDGNFLDANPASLNLLGFTRDEIKSLNFSSILSEDQMPLAFQAIEELRNKGYQEKITEVRLKHKNGEYVDVETKASIIYRDGKPYAVQGIARDITERKKAEEALRISEERYRLLFERNLAGVFRTTLDGRILDCNDSVVRMFGYGSREELMSHQMWDVYPERKERERFLSLLMKQKILLNHEICLKRKDGALLWCLANASLLEDKDSGFSTIEGTLIDITERKRAEELLRTSEAQLSNAMKIAKLGYWEYEVAKDLFTFDDHFYAIFRTTAEKVGGYTMSSARYAKLFVHPEDQPLVGIEVRKALEATDPHFSRQLEHRIIYADGETGYITVRFFIVKDDKGNTVRTYGANQDITERKKAEEDLRESEQRYKGVVDNIGIGVSLISPNMEILFLNKQMKKWFSNVDISKKAVCYRAFNNPPKDEICSYCPTYKTLQDGEVHESITDTSSGNQIINYRVISSPIKDKGGKIISAIEMVEDITERKKLQEQLIRTEKLAAVGTLAYGIAHEFNNIMAGILINSELGLATGEPQQIKECFQTIAENSQRASSITNNLLAFARQKEAKKELIDVTEPLRSVLAITRRELEKLNIEMEEKFKPVPKIYCDAGQFSEVFLNMITNARDAMRPGGGKLFIQVDSLKDDVRIIFQDTGCGIPEELGNKIFEPFVTTKGALGKSDIPGTGLGLFLSYGIIDGYKGKIEVESKVGEGTKFTILIPISKNQPEKSTADTAIESSEETERRLKILVVDDEKPITLSLKKYLESRGHQVTASLKAREGLKLFQKDKFDLVLSDILMPDMDGIELIKKIREKNKDSRIIVMTGQILREKEEAREAGADEVLIKPFKNEILNSTINRVMTKSEAEN